MRILIVHNRYLNSGGEDVVYRNERDLLRQHNHTVIEYLADNQEISNISKFTAVADTIWSTGHYKMLSALLIKEKPDLVHFHNTFLRISPAAYYACYRAGIPTVQTLHNYRLLCPSADFLRNGQVCEKCLHWKFPLPSIKHACYRDSYLQTSTVVAMLSTHRVLGTWHNLVDVYVALTNFARQKYILGGLPSDKIVVKPNFLNKDPGQQRQSGGYAVFVGRLSAEKGIKLLLQSWNNLKNTELKIIGTGPLEAEIHSFIEQHALTNITMLGQCDYETVLNTIKGAAFLVSPSECYETFSMTGVEAFACSVPVIAPNQGAFSELVTDGQTGLHFLSGSSDDLGAKLRWACEHPQEMVRMGKNARLQYERYYTAENNYQQLLAIYEQAIQSKNQRNRKSVVASLDSAA